jgi:hypothetical protein
MFANNPMRSDAYQSGANNDPCCPVTFHRQFQDGTCLSNRDRSNWQYFLDSWAHVRGPSETDQETEKQRNAPYYARAFSGARLTADSPAR